MNVKRKSQAKAKFKSSKMFKYTGHLYESKCTKWAKDSLRRFTFVGPEDNPLGHSSQVLLTYMCHVTSHSTRKAQVIFKKHYKIHSMLISLLMVNLTVKNKEKCEIGDGAGVIILTEKKKTILVTQVSHT